MSNSLTKSKKYQHFVFKCDLGIMAWPGLIVNYAGLQLRVRNVTFACGTTIESVAVECTFGSGMWATRCMMAAPNSLHSSRIMVLSLVSNWRGMSNDMLQFYRGRNEHMVSVVKDGRAALDTRWRISYHLLCAVVRLVMHMCALEQRMLGPRYDVFGSWPVCPDHIVRRYL